jgi:hypothetical protein
VVAPKATSSRRETAAKREHVLKRKACERLQTQKSPRMAGMKKPAEAGSKISYG